MSLIAKISSKGQVTVPAEIRRALGVKAGDALIWDMQSKHQAVVCRARPVDPEYLAAISGTLSEWDTPEDDEAFREL
jgi:AbrB family looped-hinge helix DNA binding protein